MKKYLIRLTFILLLYRKYWDEALSLVPVNLKFNIMYNFTNKDSCMHLKFFSSYINAKLKWTILTWHLWAIDLSYLGSVPPGHNWVSTVFIFWSIRTYLFDLKGFLIQKYEKFEIFSKKQDNNLMIYFQTIQ